MQYVRYEHYASVVSFLIDLFTLLSPGRSSIEKTKQNKKKKKTKTKKKTKKKKKKKNTNASLTAPGSCQHCAHDVERSINRPSLHFFLAGLVL